MAEKKPRIEVGEAARIVGYPCPYCKRLLSGVACVGEGVGGKVIEPEKGDTTICSYCLNWLVFNADGSTHPITEDEIQSLSDDELQNLSKLTRALGDSSRQQYMSTLPKSQTLFLRRG